MQKMQRRRKFQAHPNEALSKVFSFTVSINFRFSISWLLSLISFDVNQVLIWSRLRWKRNSITTICILLLDIREIFLQIRQYLYNTSPMYSIVEKKQHLKLLWTFYKQKQYLTWSFLISFLRSASYFSFWLVFEALWSCNKFTSRYKDMATEMRLYFTKVEDFTSS